LRFAYHNHSWELANDAEILDVLVKHTEPADVSLVLDIAWAHLGGIPIENLLSQYGERIAYLHIKDVSGETFCELGTGAVDLDHVLQLADANGIEWLVVEQDYTERSAEESMTINRDFLSDRGW
jgi:sugar phosphate isomerase/epimerase